MNTEKLLFGDELLVAALGQLKPRSSFRIAGESDVVNAFYQAREKRKFAVFFKNYAFDTEGLKPISAAISEGLDTLQQSRMVGRMNPDLVNYTIDPALKTRYDQSVKKKLVGKEDLAWELADEIKGSLTTDQRHVRRYNLFKQRGLDFRVQLTPLLLNQKFVQFARAPINEPCVLHS